MRISVGLAGIEVAVGVASLFGGTVGVASSWTTGSSVVLNNVKADSANVMKMTIARTPDNARTTVLEYTDGILYLQIR